MPCSRMPKCSVRPYSCPGNFLVECSTGMNDGWPSIVVLLEPARSADPPHSSGSTSARALRTLPDAARVATPFSDASKTGSSSVQPAGSVRETSRSSSAAPSGLAVRHASYDRSQAARSADCRWATARVWARTSSSMWKLTSGSRPSSFFRPATSSTPMAEPWMPPVFCLVGDGQPMMVRRAMNDGLPVSALAASRAAASASTSSAYPVPPTVQSTRWVCQP
ncbi:hypothetical protein ISCU110981_19900 [Isoptericola cucumis]